MNKPIEPPETQPDSQLGEVPQVTIRRFVLAAEELIQASKVVLFGERDSKDALADPDVNLAIGTSQGCPHVVPSADAMACISLSGRILHNSAADPKYRKGLCRSNQFHRVEGILRRWIKAGCPDPKASIDGDIFVSTERFLDWNDMAVDYRGHE